MLIGTTLTLIGHQYVFAFMTAVLLLLAAVAFTRTLYGKIRPDRRSDAPRHQK